MTPAAIGALIGLLLAAVDWLLLRSLAGRVDLDETKTALKTVGLVQFVALPLIGWFVAPYVIGE
ncbi:hypothetical protein CSC94_05665 [Zhengella mangrovi]|uniref:Uncharacterized protein n=2 Tax=Zhengella mangrovi TaxID=1982044 RepID=A0A2G1QSE4_9HYPH|nr:hypothetical protein CSC94_05665 [Zhengella mangrovi]